VNIGLVQVDGRVPNLALMKCAGYHLDQGDTVEWFNGMLFANQYDEIYVSKIFEQSTMPPLPDHATIGGTGIDPTIALPAKIERHKPSYELHPNWKCHIGFTMKGCRFNCSFCVVPRKEGRPKDNALIDELLINPNGGNRLMLLDNDFFAGTAWRDHLERIIELKLKVCFAQGLNIRIITSEQAALLSRVDYRMTNFKDRMITFAWDKIDDEQLILDGIDRCELNGIPPKQMQFFVLIGYNTTPAEDYHRVMMLAARGALPFVMPYDRSNHYQRRFARWVNRRAIFKTVRWEEFK